MFFAVKGLITFYEVMKRLILGESISSNEKNVTQPSKYLLVQVFNAYLMV